MIYLITSQIILLFLVSIYIDSHLPSIYCDATGNSNMTPNSNAAEDLTSNPFKEPTCLYLGSHRDPTSKVPYKLTLKKSDLKSDFVYKLKLQSQITTGYNWMCLGIFKLEEYPVKSSTTHNQDLKDYLTKDHKLKVAQNGCENHGLHSSRFVSLQDESHEQGIVGAPEHSFSSLTVKPHVKTGTHVVVLGYGRPFGTDDFSCFKEVHVEVLE